MIKLYVYVVYLRWAITIKMLPRIVFINLKFEPKRRRRRGGMIVVGVKYKMIKICRNY